MGLKQVGSNEGTTSSSAVGALESQILRVHAAFETLVRRSSPKRLPLRASRHGQMRQLDKAVFKDA
eukprot:145221-Amphidinium_carterae.1